ncbi:MAG: ROK family protein [Alphaproteobacteria bacterium]|nr:ROK family protein [Alphaproteobacteria bacterium]
MSDRHRRLRIGIDLGGTKIEAIAIDAAGGQLARMRQATPKGDYRATLTALANIARQMQTRSDTARNFDEVTVGIGMPGSISPATGLVQNANSVWLNGQPFLADVTDAVGLPIRIANDANCFVLSEAIDGAGVRARSVFGVILGTGTGGGFVYDRRIIDGPRGIGGEWGHNPLPWAEPEEHPGPQCWCGRRGCMEAWVSGPGLAADHQRQTGDALKPEAIVRSAQGGHIEAIATLDRHTSRLARGLAHVINILDPEILVLGGGLSKLEHLYDKLPPAILPHLFTDAPHVDIRPPRWGDASGVRGAAWLWQAEPGQPNQDDEASAQ